MNKKATIENVVRQAYESGVFNGAWLYAEDGRIVSKGALGYRDPSNQLPLKEDSIFEMASVTKQFTAAAIMLLAREGALNLDDPYAEFFPEFPYKDVTIRHLLNHTSGMPDSFSIEAWTAEVLKKENRIPPCSEALGFILKSKEPLKQAPGETFRYTDVGYCLAANVIEKVSGASFEEYLKKNIFEPASMKDSGIFHIRRDGRPSDRFACNMVYENGAFVPSDRSKQYRDYVVGSNGMNGCDYLYTTIFDMLAWDKALREERVLTKKEQEIMYTPTMLSNGTKACFDEKEGAGYGLGWGVRNHPKLGLVVSHAGNMPGVRTWFERFIDANRVLVIMNCKEGKNPAEYYDFLSKTRVIVQNEE